jgi:DNA-binding transcriptional LysR family regulator
MELSQVEAFLAVVDERHFGRAAARLHLAQPALSKRVQRLEASLGVRLLERSPRGVTLTDAGEAFLGEARRVTAQAARAREAARSAGRGEVGRLAIGFSPAAANAVLPAVVRRFRAERPGVAVELHELWSADQWEALAAGRLDAGLGQSPEPAAVPDLTAQVIREDRLVVALPDGHRLAGAAEIELAALAGEAFVLFPRRHAPAYFDEIVAACLAAGFSPRIVQEVKEIDATLGLVAAGVGISLLPQSATALRRDGVGYAALAGSSPVSRTAILWRDGAVSPMLQAFIDTALDSR